MDCEEAKRFLDAYLDGGLDVRRHLELEQHLSFCQSCQSLAQELRNSDPSLRPSRLIKHPLS